jgi:hypothetical protein
MRQKGPFIMDIRVLRSLATCALYPYLEDKYSGGSHNGGADPNGAEFPDEIANAVLRVPRGGAATWSAPSFFAVGFNFALALAAAIANDPAHSPDLEIQIATAKARLAEIENEAA